MAEEKPTDATEAPAGKEVVSDAVQSTEKDADSEPEEDPKKLLPKTTPSAEPPVAAATEEKRKSSGGISLAVAFREESNLGSEHPDPEKEVLDELKELLRSAIANGDFSSPLQPPYESVPSPALKSEKPKTEENPVTDAEKDEEGVSVDGDGAKTVEAIEETIVPVPASTMTASAEVTMTEVILWGVPLLGDERSDTVLLKFLRARDFKAKEALTMIKNTVVWRRVFDIEGLIKEDLRAEEMKKVVFMSGADREGHPVCYNAYGEFQSEELYAKAFGDAEKKQRFLRWRIQHLEKGIRQHLDFKPGGISTMVQVTDLKNSPGPLKEFRQALALLLDNYPEFVKKQVFVNVPWWYLAFNRMISPFLTQRTKSKFVFAGPSKSAETLFRYIAPEQVPLQFGGLYSDNISDFTIADSATEINIKPSSKQTVEIPVTGQCLIVWEIRVLDWDIFYSAEFVPDSNGSYTVILHKESKLMPSHEHVVKNSFKACESGKVIFTVDNSSNKRKMLLYRYKVKRSQSS